MKTITTICVALAILLSSCNNTCEKCCNEKTNVDSTAVQVDSIAADSILTGITVTK